MTEALSTTDLDRREDDVKHRPVWIALAEQGTLAGLIESIRIVSDPKTFLGLLENVRSGIAVVAEPPASAAVLDQVMGTRRRRSRFRVVHLAPEADIEA